MLVCLYSSSREGFHDRDCHLSPLYTPKTISIFPSYPRCMSPQFPWKMHYLSGPSLCPQTSTSASSSLLPSSFALVSSYRPNNQFYITSSVELQLYRISQLSLLKTSCHTYLRRCSPLAATCLNAMGYIMIYVPVNPSLCTNKPKYFSLVVCGTTWPSILI